MKIVIYRNLNGNFQFKAFKQWKSIAGQLGFQIEEHVTKNTSTITVYRDMNTATFTIFYSKSGAQLCLDYLRLEPADPQLVKLIDRLIQEMNLSGEKHTITESVRSCTFFNKGKAVDSGHIHEQSKFELLLIRETILGFVHLSLDRMIEFQRSGNLDKVTEIKESLSDYQKYLDQLTEQINNSK